MTVPNAGAFHGAEHRLPVRVYYEDTDFSGFVYHASYVRFFERGRTDALRVLGVHHTELLAQDCVFVVRRMEVDYLRPAVVDDALVVRTVCEFARGARMILLQSIDCDGVTLATAKIEAALISRNGRPRKLPPELVAKLAPWFAKGAP